MIDQKPLIIEAIAQMDTSLLNSLLDNQKTYQDAPKSLFLAKLHNQFQQLKKDGDSALKVFKGVCNSASCSGKGCLGYSFVGDQSGNRLDLVFVQGEFDFKDIYDCHEFLPENPNHQSGRKYDIHIYEDEKTGFETSIDLSILFTRCQKAYSDIINEDTPIINKTLALDWLKKYENLYKCFDFMDSIRYQYVDQLYPSYEVHVFRCCNCL